MDFAYHLKTDNDLFDNYFFNTDVANGNVDVVADDVFKPTTTTSPTRTRRVTITEIVDENVDWDKLDDDGADGEFRNDELLDVDEIFQLLSDVVDDWKLKLEWVVAEGLKKMRKSTKEKKTMMKYLPGNKLVGAAKEAILMDWRTEFVRTLGSTQKKLEKLSSGKMKEVDKLTMSVNRKTKSRDHDMNKNKKRLVHIECCNPDNRNIGQLLRELDKMCQRLGQHEVFWKPNVPIFNQDNKKQVVSASQTPLPTQKWENLQNFLSSKMTAPPPDTRLVGNIYSDLEAKLELQEQEEKRKILMAVAAKKPNKLVGTNAVLAQQRMRCRKVVRRGQKDDMAKDKAAAVGSGYRLKEIKRGGKKQFLLIKKREAAERPAVEEIFTEWKANLEQERLDRVSNRKPRVRKLSHRAQRKAVLKEDVKCGPLLYSDVLKKNLKSTSSNNNNTPIEDIFEAWRDYLQELDSLLSEDLSIPSSPEPVRDQPVERQHRLKRDILLEQEAYFASWRHNFGGDAVNVRGCRKRQKTFDADNFFASWRHNLEPEVGVKPPTEKYCSPENHFSAWRQIFDPVEAVVVVTKPTEDAAADPVDIFCDWMPNLFDDDDDYHPDDHRLIKNKKRAQRKSHNLKRKRHF